MNKKKLAKLGVSLALVGAIGVGSTLAYLSSQSERLKNSIVIGDGFNDNDPTKPAIILDETFWKNSPEDVNHNKSPYDDEKTCDGNTYSNVLAGSTLTKDPTVRVRADSPEAYVFIKVKGLDSLVAKRNKNDEKVFDVSINTQNWTKYKDDKELIGEEDDGGLDGVYFYGKVDENTIINVTHATEDKGYYSTQALFNNIVVKDVANFIDKTTNEKISVDDIYVGACAVQAKTNNGFVSVNDAYDDAQFPSFS